VRLVGIHAQYETPCKKLWRGSRPVRLTRGRIDRDRGGFCVAGKLKCKSLSGMPFVPTVRLTK
jgi:hypothetical protein